MNYKLTQGGSEVAGNGAAVAVVDKILNAQNNVFGGFFHTCQYPVDDTARYTVGQKFCNESFVRSAERRRTLRKLVKNIDENVGRGSKQVASEFIAVRCVERVCIEFCIVFENVKHLKKSVAPRIDRVVFGERINDFVIKNPIKKFIFILKMVVERLAVQSAGGSDVGNGDFFKCSLFHQRPEAVGNCFFCYC